MTAHSLYGPSGFKRIMLCPGSVRMCRARQGLETTDYAREGDKAHVLAAHVVKNGLVLDQFKGLTLGINTGGDTIIEVEGTPEILDTVRPYMQKCKYLIGANPSAWWSTEFCWDMSWMHPEMWGTSDFALISVGKRGYIWDLKAGAGEYVDAENNPQLMLYALAMIGPENVYHLQDIEMGIVQPNHYGDGEKVRSHVMTVQELYKWLDEIGKPAILAAQAPSALCIPGKIQCQFCDAMPCPAVANITKEIVPSEQNRALALPEEMTGEDLAQVMKLIPVINKFVKAVKKEIRRRHDTDHADPAPGYELAKGKTLREWNKSDEEIVQDLSIYINPDVIYSPQSVKSVKQIEDTLEAAGIDKSVVSHLIKTSNPLTMKPVSPNNKKPLAEPAEMFNKGD